jgi:hypothetical protein
MYQVGFGDCFLVSFEYAAPLPDGRAERHVLLDFGSNHSPWPRFSMDRVAARIREHTGGRLDVVIVTHRHRDHLSGFGPAASGQVIEGLKPALVVRPWTENPDAASDAAGPALGERSRRFAEGLAAGDRFASALAESLGEGRGLSGRVGAMAATQVANRAAIERLDRMAAAGAASYVFYGSASGMETLVPGVRARVIGPPTIEQWPEITGERADDPEYWIAQRGLLAQALAEAGVRRPVTAARVADDVEPGAVRWLIERMEVQHVASLRRIVRRLDDALNNTSVILLLEAGDKRLLFPGDAQIENWRYALASAPDREEVRGILGAVDLYKVGHHGSRNATPRSLFGLWGFERDQAAPLCALMSTLHGVYGEGPTTVPRSTLVAALDRRTNLYTTDRLPATQPWIEVVAPLSGVEPFSRVDVVQHRTG